VCGLNPWHWTIKVRECGTKIGGWARLPYYIKLLDVLLSREIWTDLSLYS
jgi:hypothetical protein